MSLEKLSAEDVLSTSAKNIIKTSIEYEKHKIKKAGEKYGPNIVWAHQMPYILYEEFIHRNNISNKIKEDIIDLEIRIGQLHKTLRGCVDGSDVDF